MNHATRVWLETLLPVIQEALATGCEIEASVDGITWINVTGRGELQGIKANHLYRVKRPTHIVNGREVPAPVKQVKPDTRYWYPTLAGKRLAAVAHVGIHDTDFIERTRSRGLLFETQCDCIANVEAMLNLPKGSLAEAELEGEVDGL